MLGALIPFPRPKAKAGPNAPSSRHEARIQASASIGTCVASTGLEKRHEHRHTLVDRAAHADRRPFLIARGRIKAAIRAWFEEQGFTEVDTGCLQVSPGNEAHLHAFATELVGPDLSRRSLYLHTSPEIACKKLLAAGETKIFTFAPVFRNRERGSLHAPEFTMLEWYRAEAPYETVMADAAAILKLAAETVDNRFVSWRGVTANPRAVPRAAHRRPGFQPLRRRRSCREHERATATTAIASRRWRRPRASPAGPTTRGRTFSPRC